NGYGRDDYPPASPPYDGPSYEPPNYDPYANTDYRSQPAPPQYDDYDPPGRYDSPPPPPPPGPPPSPPPRSSGGIARSHRTGRRDSGESGRKGGYADEHQGFGDMLG